MDANATPKPMRLWLRILLVVSLALNLLVIGAVAGVAIKGGPWKHGGPPHMADTAAGPMTRAFSKEDRRTIASAIRQKGQESGWDRQAHRQSIQRMLDLLEATPFDAEAFSTQMQTTVTGMQGRMSDASVAIVELLTNMSDEERAAYAARVKEKLKRKHK